MDIKVKKLYGDAKIPTFGTPRSACADLYAYLSKDTTDQVFYDYDGRMFVDIPPHSTVKVGTGLAMELPDCYCALIFARSGLATKEGLAPANAVGVGDSDYRGEYIVPLHNHSAYTRRVYHGDRIAQVMFQPVIQPCFVPVDRLSDTTRGTGGFGSTGKE